MVHADNYTETDIRDALSAHHKREPECLLTMVTFQTDEPEKSGIVITDKRGVMQQFFEKVQNAPGSIANGATVEKMVDTPFIKNKNFVMNLHQGDFTTANRNVEEINKIFFLPEVCTLPLHPTRPIAHRTARVRVDVVDVLTRHHSQGLDAAGRARRRG